MSDVEFEPPQGFEYHRPTLKKSTETFLVGLLLRTGYIKTRQQAGYIFLGVILLCVVSSSYLLVHIRTKEPPILNDPNYQEYLNLLNKK